VTRTYTLKRRAEQQAETRQRIIEAAVELHSTIGPAATTVSMMAERAGVQRHTFYAHFPDERSLLMACSGLAAERDPLPATDPWRAITDPAQRLAAGLRPIYDWYERNAQRTACVLRDAEHHPLVKEVGQLRFGVPMSAYTQELGAGLDARQRAMLRLATTFFTWRTLARDAGLSQHAAVDTMVRAILCAGADMTAAR
jgi:AcrR family transcriptional regulator